MIKKLIVFAVVGVVAAAAMKGSRLASYARSEICSLRETLEDEVPPEKEIARLRNEVQSLDGDTLKIVKQLAKLTSDQEELLARQKALESRKSTVSEIVKARENGLRAAEAKLKAGEVNVQVAFGEQSFSLDVAKARLKESVRDYTDADKELSRLRAKADTQQRIIDKLEKQRLVMSRLKTDLDASIDTLEDELAGLNLEQMESKYSTGRDETRVAQIKESIAKQKKKFDIRRRELLMLKDSDSQSSTNHESVDEIMAPISGASKAPAKSTKND